MVFSGLMLGCVGLDATFGNVRYAFGNVNLYKGLDFIIFIMGVFGITELMYTIAVPEDKGDIFSFKFKELYPTVSELKEVTPAITRGGLFGFIVGFVDDGGTFFKNLHKRTEKGRLQAGIDLWGHFGR